MKGTGQIIQGKEEGEEAVAVVVQGIGMQGMIKMGKLLAKFHLMQLVNKRISWMVSCFNTFTIICYTHN